MRHRGKATPRVRTYRSKLEADYADHLAMLLQAGVIARWDYEAEKFRLADGAWYTPDFRVVYPDRHVEFHETKGYRREAAIVRVKVAAELHPYPFVLVERKRGQWKCTTI